MTSSLVPDPPTAAAAAPPHWLLEAVDHPCDLVFDEILAGIVQLTGAAEATLETGSGADGRILARVRPPSPLSPPSAASGPASASTTTLVPVELGFAGGAVDLRIVTVDPLDDDVLVAVEALAEMTARLLVERQAARLARDEPWGLVVVRFDGVLRVVSPMVRDLMRLGPDDALGRNVFDIVHPDDHAMAIDSLARTAAFPGEKYPLDLRFQRPDGTSCLLEVTAEDRADTAAGDIVFAVRRVDLRSGDDALAGDQVRVLEMIGRGERIETTLAEIARLASRRLGVAGVVLLAARSEAVLRVASSEGLSTGLLAALDLTPIDPAANACGAATYRRQAIRTGNLMTDPAWSAQRALLEEAGFASCWANPIVSHRVAHSLGVLAFFAAADWAPSPADVRVADLFASLASVAVQRGAAEADLHHQAMHDHLTGLPNRALFLDRLEQALVQRERRGTTVAVMFLDLDRFKVINDALGHDVGDELLVAVAARIQSVTRTGTTVARFGGDEFTVLADSVRSPRDALAIAERIVDAFREPLLIAGGEVVMSVSIGVVLSRSGPVRPAEMLRDADSAMYRAKHRGRNRVEIFDDHMRSLAVARLELEHALKDSVERGEFALHYQPEIDLHHLRLVGVEALLRWSHPVRGMVPPVDFIPVAEETGAIVELGEWVLTEACRQLLEWDRSAGARGHGVLPLMWVNMSVVQLLHREFPERVGRVIESTGVDPQRLGLEITESALMSDIDAAIASLGKLKGLGVQTAIDDFGTGYASLAYLRRLPVDLVKIDRSFVVDLGVDRQSDAIVGSMVDLVHATGARVIAEGVETEQQFEVLREIGCDEAQGYWLGRPAPPSPTTPTWTYAG